MKNTKMKELLQKLGTLMALAILVLIFCITMPDKFMKVGNFMNILKQSIFQIALHALPIF